MADKRILRLIGVLYGGMTAAVAFIACLVVSDHLSGRMSLEAVSRPVVQISATAR